MGPCAVSSSSAAVQATYYVSPEGLDTNNGTSTTTPFKTLNHAQTVVRTLNASMTGDLVVVVRGGPYYESLTLNENDSGNNGFNVIWEAYPGEHPVLNGATQFTGWTLYDSTKNIWKSTAVTGVQTRQLFVNNRRAVRARSTGGLDNVGWNSTGNTTTDTFLAGWKKPSDLEMVYEDSYTASRCDVSSIAVSSGTATLTMAQPGWYYCENKGGSMSTTPVYYENAYELLTQPGYWYYDSTGVVNGTSGVMYYMPRTGEDMTSASVYAATTQQILTISPTTPSNLSLTVHNVEFQGIGFQYSTWMYPSGTNGFSGVQASVLRQYNGTSADETLPGAAVTVTSGHSIQFQGCVFQDMGGAALTLTTGTQSSTVNGCTFLNCSGNGIQAGDPDYIANNYNPSDSRYLLLSDTLSNNYIGNYGIDFRASTGIFAAYPQSMTISQNEVANGPGTGIALGWAWDQSGGANKLNAISNNYVHDVMEVMTDGGSIYVMGQSGSSSALSTISGNFMSEINPVCLNERGAIYFDQGSSWYTVSNNVVNTSPQFAFLWTAEDSDITVSNTYSTTSAYENFGTSCTVAAATLYTSPSYPTAAQTIINAAGITSAYQSAKPNPSVGPVQGAYQESTAANNITCFEAENYSLNLAQLNRAWVLTTEWTGYSGTGYMRVPNLNTGPASVAQAPHLQYAINFTTTGTHYVWVRGNPNADSNSDSVYVSLDNAQPTSTSWEQMQENRTFNWVNANSSGTVVTVNVATTGIHTLDLWMREDGVAIDSILLTTSSSYVPTGTGPGSSTLAGIPPQFSTTEPSVVGTLGTAYFYSYSTAGYPAPTFSVSSGSLPPGLTLSPAGVISGTATAGGVYTGVITITNASGTATQNFSIAVQYAPTITGMQLTNLATSGTAILGYNAGGASLTTLGTSFIHPGAVPLQYTTSINDGVGSTFVDTYSNSGSDGYVGITYASAITSTVSSLNLTMHIFSDGGWFGPNNTSASGVVGGSTGGSLVAAALTDPQVQITTDGTTWSNVATTDNYASKLTGAPANGSAAPIVTFTLTTPVTGIKGIRLIGPNGGTSGVGSYHGFIGVNQLQVMAQPLPAGKLSTAYSYTFSSTGYPVPTFSLSSGSLPPGLTLSSAGVISGTPNTSGVYTGVITATNAIGTGTASFVIAVK